MESCRKIDLPKKVSKIINILQEHGYEAYVVGGCVRDTILGRTPEDWDITTSATPMQVKELFSYTIDTGIEHGTVTVMIEREGFEVTTYRVDGEYEDNRHPKEVSFTRNLQEDLKRRDFTINAMAYNQTDGLVDIFGGIEDLQLGIIRCVGNAKERFGEDALRILRAIRFAAQLGFRVEDKTAEAAGELASTLIHISAERIQTELVKLLVSPNPQMIREAYEMGITKVVLPELDRAMETGQETIHHAYCVGEHLIQTVLNVPADRYLRLGALFHDIAKPEVKTRSEEAAHFYGHDEASERMAKTILRRLKFDNETIRVVCRLVRYHDYHCRIEPTAKNVRKAMNLIGKELFPYYIALHRADVLAQSEYKRKEKLESADRLERIYEEIVSKKECVSLKELDINGNDLRKVGIAPGKQMGEILHFLLEKVIEEPEYNEKEKLLELVALNWGRTLI